MPETPAHHLLVIGCGSIGERHLRCFQQTGRATVTACDTNPALLERMRTTYGVPVATDAGQALSGGAFTGAVICTPAPWHVPIGIKAMRGGAHVLIEKPLSHSLQDVDTLLRTRDETGKQAAVAYVYRVFPFLVAAQDFLRTSGLGPILQATATSGQAFHRLRPAYAQTYYRDRALGEKWIAGAALDTHYEYPLPAAHPLWRFPNVILTPHISGSSLGPNYRPRIWEVFSLNPGRLARGGPLLNELTAAQLAGA